MPDSPPTLAELLRRLQELAQQIVNLTVELREDRRNADAKYVIKETYKAEREGDDRRMREIEGDLKTGADFRRQVQAGLLLLFCTTLVGIALALAGLR